MAGDWIPVRCDLQDDPAVIGIGAILDISPAHVVGLLVRVWGWANRQCKDGHAPNVTGKWIDSYVGFDGFAEAMAKVNWLKLNDSGAMIPKFDRFNSMAAKRRIASTERSREHRGRKTNTTKMQRERAETRRIQSTERSRKHRGREDHATQMQHKGVANSLPEKRREEKRREENNEKNNPLIQAEIPVGDAKPLQSSGRTLKSKARISGSRDGHIHDLEEAFSQIPSENRPETAAADTPEVDEAEETRFEEALTVHFHPQRVHYGLRRKAYELAFERDGGCGVDRIIEGLARLKAQGRPGSDLGTVVNEIRKETSNGETRKYGTDPADPTKVHAKPGKYSGIGKKIVTSSALRKSKQEALDRAAAVNDGSRPRRQNRTA